MFDVLWRERHIESYESQSVGIVRSKIDCSRGQFSAGEHQRDITAPEASGDDQIFDIAALRDGQATVGYAS
jgi:hypothetical protein